jgi:Protein of unknown function (DUF664)
LGRRYLAKPAAQENEVLMEEMASYLLRYLQQGRDTVMRGLEGLSDYDSRRPLTPTGTNVLGLVKHLAGVETASLGECVGRPSPVRLPWVEDDSIWDGADMWVTPDQSSEYITGLYRQAWLHSDESVEQLSLDAPAHVAWWPAERRTTTFGHLLVRVVAETAQHAGQIDILREGIDGHAAPDHDEIGGPDVWAAYVAKIQEAADGFR